MDSFSSPAKLQAVAIDGLSPAAWESFLGMKIQSER
jgi:hypothetical protein